MPKRKELFSEHLRRATSLVMVWLSWTYCIVVFLIASFEYDPSKGHFAPQWVSFSFFLAIGIGILSGLVRSRMRLRDSIIKSFQAGMDSVTARVDSVVIHDLESVEHDGDHHHMH